MEEKEVKKVKRELDYKKIAYVVAIILLIFIVIQCSSKEKVKQTQETMQPIDAPFQNPFTKLQGEVHQGDLVIENEIYEIIDKKFVLEGNLIIKDSGKVIIKNSELGFLQRYNNHYGIEVHDHSSLIMDNVKIKTNKKWLTANFNDYAEVTFNKVTSWDDNIPWYNARKDSKVSITESTIGITVSERTEVDAINSNLFFELIFDESQGEINFPIGYVKDFAMDVENGQGTYSISAKDTTLKWGATLNKNSDITFTNTKLTLGINAGSSNKKEPSIKVSDLKAKKYSDFTLNFDTNRIKLINTEVTSWYPQAFQEATLEITYSDLADLQWNSGNAHVIVRDSTSSMVFGRDNVQYDIYDSKIKGDIVATDNSKIYLYNTRVDGDLKEINSGEIYVDGKRWVE